MTLAIRTVQKQSPSVIVGGHTLQQGQRIADPVGGGRCELRRIQKRVHGNDLLKQSRHDS